MSGGSRLPPSAAVRLLVSPLPVLVPPPSTKSHPFIPVQLVGKVQQLQEG